MKKLLGILALAALCLGATTVRADEPVLSTSGRFMDLSSRPASFSDNTLTLDASATLEISTRESFSIGDRRFTGHYEWFNRTHRGSVTTISTPQAVPEPSALLFLLCGCLALTALSCKLTNSNS
jgi:hypothetical protein